MRSNYSKVQDTLVNAAREIGVDAKSVILIAGLESSFSATAKSESNATGLGQFTGRTFLSVIKNSDHPELKKLANSGLKRAQILEYRNNPRINALALAQHTKDNIAVVKNAFKANGIKDQVTTADVYVVHNVGNPTIAVQSRLGGGVSSGVSQSAMELNRGLYKNGINTKASDYIARVNQKFVDIDYVLRNGK